ARRAAFGVALAGLAGLGVASDVAISRAETWRSQWNYTRDSDRIIARAEAPALVLAERTPGGMTHAAELACYVPPETRFALIAPGAPDVPPGFASVFAVEPSPDLRRALEARGASVDLVDA